VVLKTFERVIVETAEPIDVVLSRVNPAAAGGVPHLIPVAVDESAVKTELFDPTPKRTGVDAPVAAMMSPLVVSKESGICASICVLSVESIDDPRVRIAAAPSLTSAVSSGVVHP
jgi:hypothetical protein